MLLQVIILVFLAMLLDSSESGAFTTYSTSTHQRIIASAMVPDRDNAPLYFSVQAGQLEAGEAHGIASGDGVYYQSSGAVDIDMAGKTTTLQAGDGVFVPVGTKLVLKPHRSNQVSAYLRFLLLPHRSMSPGKTLPEHDVYRSAAPLSQIMPVRNLLTLGKVEVPPQSPCDPLHRRSGAALHYILSGFGAEFTENQATARGPGAVSYEPNGLAYQWSNPGTTPLVYLIFDVNPDGVAPVIAANAGPQDAFASRSQTVAIYCVAAAMFLTVIAAARIAADSCRDVKSGTGHHKK
jgi:hypothetical protein